VAGCSMTLSPSNALVVGGDPVTAGPLGESQSARFSFLVGGDAVRLDVADLNNGSAGSLLIRVYDANGVLYAQTTSRQYFAAPSLEVAGGGPEGLGIVASAVYSINLPANFGRGHLEVTNLALEPTTVEAVAVRRAPLPYSANDLAAPEPFDRLGAGALVFLSQVDAWRYVGGAGATLEFRGGEIVHATAKVARGLETLARLEPGERFTGLEYGDMVYVQTQGNGAYAGFCDTLPGCEDGSTTGEYLLEVVP